MQAPAVKPAPVEITTLLGKGARFEGKLFFEGAVRIDGAFKGEVFADGLLVIGEGAVVEAEIEIGEIVVQGQVTGNVRAQRSIEVGASGRVKGDLTTPSLQIDRGAVFEGRCFMEAALQGDRPGGSGARGGKGPQPVK